MLVTTTISQGVQSSSAITDHIFATGITNWADYENDVAEGVIRDMDDEVYVSDSTSESGSEHENRRSRASSNSTLPDPQTFLERIEGLLKASVAANQATQPIVVFRESQPSLNPLATAFALSSSPANPEGQLMKNHIENGFERHALQLRDCQEKGDIQGFIDLTVAGPVPRTNDSIQSSIDKIVAADALKKQEEMAHFGSLFQGLRASAGVRPQFI